MTTSEQRAKTIAMHVNNVKMMFPSFTLKELNIWLQSEGCPYPEHIGTILKKSKLIVKENGLYSFVSTTPIHFGMIRESIDNLVDRIIGYQKKCKTIKRPELITNISKTLDITEAINILKEAGYKILAPIVTFEEI